jgi:hypothetical protein
MAGADWLVLEREFDTWHEPNQSAKFASDAPMQVVRDQFELCGQYGTRDCIAAAFDRHRNSNYLK